MPETSASRLDGRNLPGLHTPALPPDNNPARPHEPRYHLRSLDLLRKREQMEECRAMHHIGFDRDLPLEYIGDHEFTPKRLLIQEQLIAKLHQRALDINPCQLS